MFFIQQTSRLFSADKQTIFSRQADEQTSDKLISPVSRAQLGLCKDNASEWKESLLSVSRAQLGLCKDNASERKESLLSVSRAQLGLCKDNDNM